MTFYGTSAFLTDYPLNQFSINGDMLNEACPFLN